MKSPDRIGDEPHLKTGQPVLIGWQGLRVMLLQSSAGALDAIVSICTHDVRDECRKHLRQ